jgi:hypothetical protein
MVGAVLAACTGEDGEPGPQGDPGEKGEKGDQGAQGETGIGAAYKLGFLEGTVVGSRKDGTAFNEAFKYEYTFENVQMFRQEGDRKFFTASRSQDPTSYSPNLYMDMEQVSEGVFKPTSQSYEMDFQFSKDIGNGSLFLINASPYFASTPAYVTELSAEQNATYAFSTTQNGIYYYQTTYNSVAAYSFSSYDNGSDLQIYYSQSTGALMGIYDYDTGNTLTSGTVFNLYNKLKFKMNATVGKRVFYDATTDASLHVSFPEVPADTFTVTNYAKDATTGVITFDFEIKISGQGSTYSRQNSTGHDLTIKGKFNSGGKVYQNIVNRVRG